MVDGETKGLATVPTEVIAHIFLYLDFQDLKNARLICHKWYKASLCHQLLEREKLTFCVKGTSKEPVDVLKSARDFLHIRFANTRWDCTLKDIGSWLNSICIWPQVYNLKSLYFISCQFSGVQLVALLNQCTKLKELQVTNCHLTVSPEGEKSIPALKSKLLNLEKFLFHHNKDSELVHEVLVAVLASSPNLKSLTVQYGTSSDRGNIFDEIVLSYLRVEGSHIKELGLVMQSDYKNPNYHYNSEILSVPNLHLQELNIDIAHIGENLKNQKTLQHLSVWIEIPIAGDELNMLGELHSLTSLKLMIGVGTATYIRNLKPLKNLVTLELICEPTSDIWVEESDLLTALCYEVNTILKKLTVSCADIMSPKCVSELCRTHPALSVLNLDRFHGVNCFSIQSIFYYLTSLEILTLEACLYFDDDDLIGSQSDSPTFEHDGYTYPIGHSIARLENLRVLELTLCINTSGEVFKNNLKLPKLRELKFDFNCETPALEKECVLSLVENNPNIEKLDIEVFANSGIDVVVRRLKRLKHLEIRKKILRKK